MYSPMISRRQSAPSFPTGEYRIMNKLLSALLAALLSLAAFGAHAGLVPPSFTQQMFRNVEGEYLLVTNPSNDTQAYENLVDTIRKSGYLMMTEISSSHARVGNECRIDIHTPKRIIVACEKTSSDFDIKMSRHVWWTTPEEFKNYADVPGIVEQIREAHRRAVTTIGTK